MSDGSLRGQRRGGRAARMTLAAAMIIAGVLAAVPARGSWWPSHKEQEQGKRLFSEKGCTRCHGPGASRDADAPSLSDVGLRLKKSVIRQQILDGGKQMPAFRDVLTEAETKDLVAYLSHEKTRGQAAVPAQ